MNRNKLGVTADLKDADDLAWVRTLITRADVLVENFRPGVMARLGLDYENVATAEPSPGLRQCQRVRRRRAMAGPPRPGPAGPVHQRAALAEWRARRRSGADGAVRRRPPGQLPPRPRDHGAALPARAHGPGRAGADQSAGVDARPAVRAAEHPPQRQLCHGLARGTALRARASCRRRTGRTGTADGYLALAMNPVPRLGRLLELPELEAYLDEQQWWDHADEIAERLSARLATADTAHWLNGAGRRGRVVRAGAHLGGAGGQRWLRRDRDDPAGAPPRRCRPGAHL